jgi:ABC-type microcin C transport system permease subunit YejE
MTRSIILPVSIHSSISPVGSLSEKFKVPSASSAVPNVFIDASVNSSTYWLAFKNFLVFVASLTPEKS